VQYMRMLMKGVGAVMLLAPLYVLAGEVEILAAGFVRQSDQSWNVDVTLQHADSGWEHYADAWRIVTVKGNVLGLRTLVHPHVNEQPFTRSLGSVKLPAGMNRVYIEAHDKVHGWSAQRLVINLSQARNGQLQVQR